jgi:uncharacterized membrane protein YkvA (DUF1232 family)
VSLFWLVLIALLAVLALVVVGVSLFLWRRRAALADSQMGRVAKRIAALPLKAKARLAWRLFRDGRVPLRARAILSALVLYLAMPLDVVPDFIPVLGYLDDVLIVLAAAWLFLRLIPVPVVEEHVAALEREREATGPAAC